MDWSERAGRLTGAAVLLLCLCLALPVLAGMVFEPSGGPFSMADPSVQTFTRVNRIDILSFNDISPPFYDKGDMDVGMVIINFTAIGGAPSTSGNINAVTITHNGTGPAPLISMVYVYEDVDQDGLYEPGADDGASLGSNGTWDAFNKTTLTLTPPLNIMRSQYEHLIIVYDFSAGSFGSHGAIIDPASDVLGDSSTGDPNSLIPGGSKDVPLNQSWIKYNVSDARSLLEGDVSADFHCGESAELRVKAFNTNGPPDILGVNLTVRDPEGVVIIDDEPMDLFGSGLDWNEYNHTVKFTTAPEASPRGTYNASLKGRFVQGEHSTNITFNILNTPPQISGTLGPFYRDEDAEKWSADLLEMKSDLEDPAGSLYWNLSSVKESLVNITVDGDILHFELKPEASGDDEVDLILNDTDGDGAVLKFWVNVAPVNDPPVISPPVAAQEKKEDAKTWELDLSAHETDVEDAFPSDTLTWSVSDVDENLVKAKIKDDVLTITPQPDANGETNINLTLKDSKAATSFQLLSIKLIPVNDAPVWSRIGNVFLSRDSSLDDVLDLSDHASDVDGDELELSVVSHSNSSSIGVELDEDDNLDITILEDGFTGSTDVVVNASDGKLWTHQSFTIAYGQTEPGRALLYLTSPPHESRVSSAEPELTWEVDLQGASAMNLRYDVYLGKNRSEVQAFDPGVLAASDVEGKSFTPEPLEDKTVYYWTVIPYLGEKEGICVSGVLSFEVNTSFTVIRNVTVLTDVTKIAVNQGEHANITIIVQNNGNDLDLIHTSLDTGDLEGSVTLNGNTTGMLLSPGESDTIVINIQLLKDSKAGTYPLTFRATSSREDVFEEVVITVEVVDEDEQDQTGYFISFILVLVIVFIVTLILIAVALGLHMYFRGIFTVEAIYLINTDGRLMYSEEEEMEDGGDEGVDGEILSGMFTAIQDLIDDSFHTEEGKGLRKKRIEFGGKNIMIQRGDNIYLVMVVKGRPGKMLERRMEESVAGIEEENPKLDRWNGNRDKLKVAHFFEGYIEPNGGDSE